MEYQDTVVLTDSGTDRRCDRPQLEDGGEQPKRSARVLSLHLTGKATAVVVAVHPVGFVIPPGKIDTVRVEQLERKDQQQDLTGIFAPVAHIAVDEVGCLAGLPVQNIAFSGFVRASRKKTNKWSSQRRAHMLFTHGRWHTLRVQNVEKVRQLAS